MNKIRLLFILSIAVVTLDGWAGNRTLVAEFDGSEDSMPVSVATAAACFEPPGFLPYQDLGILRVDQPGEYQVADMNPNGRFLDTPGAVDTVLLIYDGSFDSRIPTKNRIAVFDYGELNQVTNENFVVLDESTSYRVMLQKTCDAEPGLGSFIVRGPGEITGAGAPTPEKYYGDFSMVMTIADFPDWGTKKYESFMYTAPKTGNYWFYDVGATWDGSFADQRIYAGSFDPDNPMDNLIIAVGYWGFKVHLKAGQQVEVVNVDMFEVDSVYQMVIYPPGELRGFNPAFTGAFADASIANQGIFIESDEVLNFVFFAWFTFDDDPDAMPMNTAVGSSDQRWLSAYGFYSYDDTEVPLTFENSTGGRFNLPEPRPTQDISYGSGNLVAKDCDNIEITFDLPGTPPGVMNLKRLLEGKGRICADWVWIGSPVD